MHDIFLSYAHQDRATAEATAKALEAAGMTVWWDFHIAPGKYFDRSIEQALNECRCIVVLWTQSAIKSRWVREEAHRAQELEKLVPVLVESIELPVGFRLVQALDLSETIQSDNDLAIRELLHAVTPYVSSKANRNRSSKKKRLVESKPTQTEEYAQSATAHISETPVIPAPASPKEGRDWSGLALSWLFLSVILFIPFYFANPNSSLGTIVLVATGVSAVVSVAAWFTEE